MIQTQLLQMVFFKRMPVYARLQMNSGQNPERSVATSARSGVCSRQNKKPIKNKKGGDEMNKINDENKFCPFILIDT